MSIARKNMFLLLPVVESLLLFCLENLVWKEQNFWKIMNEGLLRLVLLKLCTGKNLFKNENIKIGT